MPSGLCDSHGRTIDYMRISVTDRCNFRCVYCMPVEGEPFIPHGNILTYEEILRVCRIASSLGVSRYKITGGEPLCRRGVVGFIADLKKLPGVEKVTLTTNGALLGPHVEELAAAGVDSVTVSLDSLSEQHLRDITRVRVPVGDILDALTRIRALGVRIKINVVPLKDYNRNDLVELARRAFDLGCHIRFIELMPVGLGGQYAGVDQAEIRASMEAAFGPLKPLERSIGNGPAVCYEVAGCKGSVGFISALTAKFCHACNRVRLTSAGFLKTCLHHEAGVQLRELLRGGATDDEVEAAIRRAVAEKPKAHDFGHSGAGELMSSIGG